MLGISIILGTQCHNFHPNILKHACKMKPTQHKFKGLFLNPYFYIFFEQSINIVYLANILVMGLNTIFLRSIYYVEAFYKIYVK